jgi:DNA polymerase delta subunit 1
MFGVTQGYSVCCLVHGFQLCFYIIDIEGMSPDGITRFLQAFKEKCGKQIEIETFQSSSRRLKMNIMHYQEQ